MKNKLACFYILVALLTIACTNETPVKEHIENAKDIIVIKTDSILALSKIKSALQGNWQKAVENDHGWTSFTIKNDTFSAIGQKEKYWIILQEDSTFSLCEILSKEQRQTTKPRMTLPEKIEKLTPDSLVLSKWNNGRKKYTHYFKK